MRFKISLNPINDFNRKALDRYILKLRSDGKLENTTIYDHNYSCERVLHIIDKNYTDITEEDLDKCFSSINPTGTRELIKTKFKIFLISAPLNL